MSLSPKITPQHLERAAYVYIRQSSPYQVAENLESQDLQYQLVQRAGCLGWPESRVVVIDEDLGKSAITATGREGFQSLAAAVGLGQVGIILVTDVSRLARNCGDWYRLLDLSIYTRKWLSCNSRETKASSPQNSHSNYASDDVFHQKMYNDWAK